MAITMRIGNIIDGNVPLLDVELGNGVKASLFEDPNDPKVEGDIMVAEKGNSLDNPRSDSNFKVGVN